LPAELVLQIAERSPSKPPVLPGLGKTEQRERSAVTCLVKDKRVRSDTACARELLLAAPYPDARVEACERAAASVTASAFFLRRDTAFVWRAVFRAGGAAASFAT